MLAGKRHVLLARTTTRKVLLAPGGIILVCACFLVLPLCSYPTSWSYSRAIFQSTLDVWIHSWWSNSAHIAKLLPGVQLPKDINKWLPKWQGSEQASFLLLHMLFPLLGVSWCPLPFPAWLTLIHSPNSAPMSLPLCRFSQFLPHHLLHFILWHLIYRMGLYRGWWLLYFYFD